MRWLPVASLLAGACSVDAYDVRLAPRDAAPSDMATIEVSVGDGGAPRSCAPPAPPGCGRAVIAGGSFVMGNPDAQDATGRAVPVQRSITVSAFALDRFEVTVGRFRRYVSENGTPAGIWTRVDDGLRSDCNWTPDPGAREGHPMNCIDWNAAAAFCAWDAADGRLPREAELEFAARGTDNRRWPWGGNERVAPSFVCWERCCEPKLGTCDEADPAFEGGRSPEGVWHLVGNVSEWAFDDYAAYTDALCWGDVPRADPVCARGQAYRAMRLGSWSSRGGAADIGILVGARNAQPVLYRHATVGFRCVAPP